MKVEKLLQKNTFIVFTQKNKRQELTKCEKEVFCDLIKYYSGCNFEPTDGLKIVSLSSYAYVDFTFMKEIYNDRYEIYITVK